MKNTFDIMSNATDPFTGAVFQVQYSTGILTYLIVCFVLIVLFYVTMKRSQDIGKSGVTGLYSSLLINVILYYWGKFGDYETISGGKSFVHDYFLWIHVILVIITIVVLKFNRSSPS